MKRINDYITERLVLVKDKKPITSITLETFVRWCETSMREIDNNKLTDNTSFDKKDIYDNLECETAKQSGLISEDDYFDFYEKHKNDYLENLVQFNGTEKEYLSFDVGGINFYVCIWSSFSDDMEKLFNIKVKNKVNW